LVPQFDEGLWQQRPSPLTEISFGILLLLSLENACNIYIPSYKLQRGKCGDYSSVAGMCAVTIVILFKFDCNNFQVLYQSVHS